MSDNENLTAGADPYAMLRARAEQAERERDEARAAVAASGGEGARYWYDRADALKAKLAEAEAALSGTRGELAEAVSAANAADEAAARRLDLYRSSRGENRALRSRLARYEAVVEAARRLTFRENDDRESVGHDEADLRNALRALDAAQAKDSGGSGAVPFGHVSKADECQVDEPGEWQGSGGSKHRCSACGCYWRLNDPTDAQPDGSWSLWDGRQKPGKCCDNVRMGEQIKPGLPLTRADVAAMIAEERERVIMAFVHAAQHGHDGQVFANRLRKAGKP